MYNTARKITLTEFLNGTSSKTRAILLDHMRTYGTSSIATFQNGNSKIVVMDRDNDIRVEVHTLMNVDVTTKATPEQITNFLGAL